jgi:hypothetical protein
MRKSIMIGLAALALGAASVGGAFAQTAAPATPPATPDVNTPAAKSGPPSVDWPIGDLLADPGAHAVLAKDLPALLTYDGLDQIKGMSIRNISQYPQAQIDDAKLAAIAADLAAIKPAS